MDPTTKVLIQIFGALILSFFLANSMSYFTIAFFRRKSASQPIREDGVKTHLKKKGTPTMGGIAIVLGTLIPLLVFAWKDLGNPTLQGLIAIYLLFFTIGFFDDLGKIRHKKTAGIPGIIRFGIEVFLILFILYRFNLLPTGRWHITFPWQGFEWYIGLWYVPFVIFMLVGSANAVNITDGLDGLASGLTMIALTPFMLIALIDKNYPIAIIIAAQVGSLLGFLKWNFHPARLFMGDTGSLALGAFLGGIAFILKQEVLLLIAGLIFVLETLSVILQVGSFQLSKKRIFAMAPWHHHFEKKGWPEWKVIMFFWMIGMVLSFIATLFGGMIK